MSNYYEDNPDIRFHLETRDLSRVIALIEDDYSDRTRYPYAPKDEEDALENYSRTLDIVGEIAEYICSRRLIRSMGAKPRSSITTHRCMASKYVSISGCQSCRNKQLHFSS